jgi:hypothetical protein
LDYSFLCDPCGFVLYLSDTTAVHASWASKKFLPLGDKIHSRFALLHTEGELPWG